MKVCPNPAYYSAGAPRGAPLDLTYKDKVTGSTRIC